MIPRLLVLLLAASLVGCEEDKIVKYTAPHITRAPASTVPEAKVVEARTLGAILPDGDGWWFFKVQGAKPQVDALAEGFDKLIGTVRLTGKADRPIEWSLPDGWTEEAPKPGQMRFLTVRPKDSPLDVSVSRFGGSLLDNVNRWRREVGQKDIAEAELEQKTKRLDVNGVKVTIVDVSGPLAPKRGPMGMGR